MKAPGTSIEVFKGNDYFTWLYRKGFVPPREQLEYSEVTLHRNNRERDFLFKSKTGVLPGYSGYTTKETHKQEASVESTPIQYEEIQSNNYHDFFEEREYGTENSEFYRRFGNKVTFYFFEVLCNPAYADYYVTKTFGEKWSEAYETNYGTSFSTGGEELTTYLQATLSLARLGRALSDTLFMKTTGATHVKQGADGSIYLYAGNLPFQKFSWNGELLEKFSDRNHTLKFITSDSPIYYWDSPGASSELTITPAMVGNYYTFDTGYSGTYSALFVRDDLTGAINRVRYGEESDSSKQFKISDSRYYPYEPYIEGEAYVAFYKRYAEDPNINYRFHTTTYKMTSSGFEKIEEKTSETIIGLTDEVVYTDIGYCGNVETTEEAVLEIPIADSHLLKIPVPAGKKGIKRDVTSYLMYNFLEYLYDYHFLLQETILNVPTYTTSWTSSESPIQPYSFHARSCSFKTAASPISVSFLKDFPINGTNGNLVDENGTVRGQINYQTGEVLFSAPLYSVAVYVSYLAKPMSCMKIDDYEFSASMMKYFGIENIADIYGLLNYIYVDSEDEAFVVWKLNDSDKVKIWSKGEIYDIDGVEGFVVYEDLVIAYNYDSSTESVIKVFDCVSKETKTILIEESVRAFYTTDDDKYIYIFTREDYSKSVDSFFGKSLRSGRWSYYRGGIMRNDAPDGITSGLSPYVKGGTLEHAHINYETLQIRIESIGYDPVTIIVLPEETGEIRTLVDESDITAVYGEINTLTGEFTFYNITPGWEKVDKVRSFYYEFTEENAGAIVIKKNDLSCKYINEDFITENDTGLPVGGAGGKIITKKGIITLCNNGTSYFKTFQEEFEDIKIQYGGQYFETKTDIHRVKRSAQLYY